MTSLYHQPARRPSEFNIGDDVQIMEDPEYLDETLYLHNHVPDKDGMLEHRYKYSKLIDDIARYAQNRTI